MNKDTHTLSLFLVIPVALIFYWVSAISRFFDCTKNRCPFSKDLRLECALISLYLSIYLYISLSLSFSFESMFFSISFDNSTSPISVLSTITTKNGFQSTEATPTSLPYCLPYLTGEEEERNQYTCSMPNTSFYMFTLIFVTFLFVLYQTWNHSIRKNIFRYLCM